MSIANSIRAQLSPIHPEGYPFIGGFALLSLVLFWLWTPLGWLGTVATLWCAYFFRDPVRVTPISKMRRGWRRSTVSSAWRQRVMKRRSASAD